MPNEGTSLLEVQNLSVEIDTGEQAFLPVDQVSFSLDSGKNMAIVGESGSGKTLTGFSILGLLPAPQIRKTGGRVLFSGRELSSLSSREIRKIRGKEIGVIFQEPMIALNPVFTVGAQIIEMLRLHLGMKERQAKEKTCELLDEVGIHQPTQTFHAYPHELSGGMKQRAMIAMAISCEPKLLIADEPTTSLDVTTQGQVMQLLKAIQDERKMSMILITHDLRLAAKYVDDIYVMYTGRMVEKVGASKLFSHAKHPYTQGLLRCQPASLSQPRAKQLETISGHVPSWNSLPEGCHFRGRCAYEGSLCKEIPKTTFVSADSDQWARCAYVTEVACD